MAEATLSEFPDRVNSGSADYTLNSTTESGFDAILEGDSDLRQSENAVPSGVAGAHPITAFMAALGYAPDDDVYLRLLVPKNFTAAKHSERYPSLVYQDKHGRLQVKKEKFRLRGPNLYKMFGDKEIHVSDNAIEYLERANQTGFAVYVVVNPGGHDAEHITGSRAVFWEADDLPKPEQLQKFTEWQAQWGGGMAIETKNSIHCYFPIDKFLSPDDAEVTQKRVIQLMASDKSIWDKPRLMRVPGFDHTSMGASGEIVRHPITIVHQWDGVLASWDRIEGDLPEYDERYFKPEKSKPASQKASKPVNLSSGGGDLAAILNDQILPRLSPEQIFNHPAHQWQQADDDKMRGYCPLPSHRNSLAEQSGSAAWTSRTSDGGTHTYQCPQCTNNRGLNPLAYRHAIKTGNPNAGKPTGRDFVEIMRELAADAGLSLPELEQSAQIAANRASITSAEIDPYEITDAAATLDHHLNVHLFKEGKGDHATIEGEFYKYSTEQGVWLFVESESVLNLIADEAKKVYQVRWDKQTVRRIHKFATNRNVISAYGYSLHQLAVPAFKREANSGLINFQNGVLNPATDEFRSHRKSDYLTYQIQAEYTPGAECPQAFKDFTGLCYGLDQLDKLRAVIRYYIDYTLPYGKFVHLVGRSGSGKGLFLRLLSKLLGTYSRELADVEFAKLNTAEGRHQFLSGVKFLAFPDIASAIGGLSGFYNLVDNHALSGRALFSKSTSKHPWNCRFATASTKTIQFENSAGGWDRRAFILETLDRDGVEDPTLGPKINDSIGDIVSWAMAMPREDVVSVLWSASSQNFAARDAQTIASDSVASFIDACLVPSTNDTIIKKANLYRQYVAYCKAVGSRPKGFDGFAKSFNTVLGRNHATNRTSKVINGQTVNIPAAFVGIQVVDDRLFGARIAPDETEPIEYDCYLSKISEGGLALFREFNQPKTAVEEPESAAPIEVEKPETTSPRMPEASDPSVIEYEYTAPDTEDNHNSYFEVGDLVFDPDTPLVVLTVAEIQKSGLTLTGYRCEYPDPHSRKHRMISVFKQPSALRPFTQRHEVAA
jgi:energy-coupling factor transporter ATP-binding protein EcfA2